MYIHAGKIREGWRKYDSNCCILCTLFFLCFLLLNVFTAAKKMTSFVFCDEEERNGEKLDEENKEGERTD